MIIPHFFSLILAGPLIPMHLRGTTSSALVHVTDWYPTLVQGLARIDIPESSGKPLDGVNLYDCLLGGEIGARRRMRRWMESRDPEEPF